MQQVHTRGKVAFAGMECTTFELSWYARGMDNLFQDLAEENGIADWLLDWFTERSCNVGRAFAQAQHQNQLLTRRIDQQPVPPTGLPKALSQIGEPPRQRARRLHLLR